MSRAFRVQISVASISIAVACLLLAAQVSQQKHLLQRRHNTDWEEIEDHDDQTDDQTDDQFEEQSYEDKSVSGQSRGFGGENRTQSKNSFPWLDILYRNPDDRFKAVQDGYLTGFAIQVEHNVLLAHKESIKRASLYHGKTLVLQGWGNLWNKKFIDPQVKVWDDPKNGYARGVVRFLNDISFDFGLYRVQSEKYPYPDKRSNEARLPRVTGEKAESRDNLPPFDWPEGKGSYAYRYPRLDKNKDETSYCYIYTLAAEDHGDYTWFDEKAPRWFSRWPIKPTWCLRDTCKFVFDESRADSRRIKRRGWPCDSWQEVGAPIMCGPRQKVTPANDNYYERRNLKLSFIVRPRRPFYNETCADDIWALRLADHVGTIEKEIDKLKKSGTL